MPEVQRHEDILQELRKKKYYPIYAFMGEEDYYIDLLSNYITEHILTEEEKDFNLTVLYGADTDIVSVIQTARRYPIMASHQVVVVKEAQSLSGDWDDLATYLKAPNHSTLLVLCYKHGKMDKRKKAVSLIEKEGILFESKKLKDYQLPAFIEGYFKEKQIGIAPQTATLIGEFVGANLSRLVGELDKLLLTLPQGERQITPEMVERNIGISKEYNSFELKNALIAKDVFKANQIIKYFESNPKNNPVQPILALLHNFFSNLMLAYYAPQKTEQGVMQCLGLKAPWQVKEYLQAMRAYNAVKVMHIVSAIRDCDARSKGVKNASVDSYQLLRQLIFFILH